jgi:hypothetical protein
MSRSSQKISKVPKNEQKFLKRTKILENELKFSKNVLKEPQNEQKFLKMNRSSQK